MNKQNRFWNWVKNEDGLRTLYLDGAIAEESWLGDEITPKQFKTELLSGEGDITIWINSPGGDVFAASVIAMAGGDVYMSPVSMIMIHNPMTIAIGDTGEMAKAIAMLSEVKESIINAYEIKTGLSRARISHLMDAESWMNAKKAVELGFADDVLFTGESPPGIVVSDGLIFSRQAVLNSTLKKLPKPEKATTTIESLQKRLFLLKL